jgi:hypothetical protein
MEPEVVGVGTVGVGDAVLVFQTEEMVASGTVVLLAVRTIFTAVTRSVADPGTLLALTVTEGIARTTGMEPDVCSSFQTIGPHFALAQRSAKQGGRVAVVPFKTGI